MNSDKSYLEIKITFIHVIVLLVAVVLLGIFLFFLGYKAGKSSLTNQMAVSGSLDGSGKEEKLQIISQRDKTKPVKSKTTSIKEEELKFHQQITNDNQTAAAGNRNKRDKKKLKPKTVAKTRYYTVQTGSFANHAEARNYSTKFTKLHYPTEVKSVNIKNKIMYRVLVGNFATREKATKEIKKLELIANRKGFFIQKIR